MKQGWITKWVWSATILLAMLPAARAQLSLTAAVDLALRNEPRIKLAQADVDKAKASLAEAKDVFIPSINTNGGYGRSIGVPLSLPVIFSFNAQSLVFNFSQHDYIRAAHAGVDAANFALQQVRDEVVEDTVTTYVNLDSALQRRESIRDISAVTGRLVKITQDRYAAGADPHIEVTRTARAEAAARLHTLQISNEVEEFSRHLSRLTGIPGAMLVTVHDSIPTMAAPTLDGPVSLHDIPGIQAAFATARAREYTARGDSRFRYRPQFGFAAGYSRVSTVGTNYTDYYLGFRNNDKTLNSFSAGVQLSIPLLDYVHAARERQAAAEARRQTYLAQDQRLNFLEGRAHTREAAMEMGVRAEIAALDRQLAQDQLDAIQIQLRAEAAPGPGPILTPKDEQNARLQERERTLDMQFLELQLHQMQITLMRQDGQLANWLHSLTAARTERAVTALEKETDLPSAPTPK